MAITRPFGYNPSQNPIPGTDSFGTLVVGSDNLDFSQNPGGIKWWMGPDETDGYVISGVVSGGTQPSPVGNIGTVNFWRTGNLTSEKFIQLANKISLQNFTTVGDAVTWLNANGYWTSYDPLLITPTPSATLPLSPTPAVTPTPTVTPSRTISGPLLDSYSGATVAYSLRRVSTVYSGSAIRVRRSSDNAEQDIGFLGNQLDTTTLTSFVGSNNGFVTAWYDQSGNGNTAFQSTVSRQPRIVNNGTVVSIGGRPSMTFINGTNSSLITSQNVRGDGYLSTFFVAGTSPTVGVYKHIINIGPSDWNKNFTIMMEAGGAYGNWFPNDPIAYGRGLMVYAGPSNAPSIVVNGDSKIYPTGQTNTVSSVFLGSSGTGYYVNGLNKASRSLYEGQDCDPTNISNPLIIGSHNLVASGSFDGFASEVVMYRFNQNSNRTGIENNINGYYLIY